MDWRTDWLALHDRIEGVEQAFNLYLAALNVSSEDPFAMRRNVFRPAFHSVFEAIMSFREAHRGHLPATATATIDRFVNQHSGILANQELDNFGHTAACATALSGFRSELRFQLTDRSAALLRLTERALLHLQRTIVADASVAGKWQGAFKEGETTCEQLGAVHLLLHRIWAFKSSASGERTDLVYNEPMPPDTATSVAEGLVLTEWKLVRAPSELAAKLAAAESQASLYSKGILGGVELADSRFIIAVSEDRLSMPPDSNAGGIMYRRRNIAVAPSTPSRSAIRRDKATQRGA